MSDELSKALWVDVADKPAKPEDRVARALKKALDSTTVERPGVPWDEEEKSEPGGYIIPGSD